MTNVLGLPLERAVAILEDEGYTVTVCETRSLKGVEGDSLRVVRQRKLAHASQKVVSIVYCRFKTVATGA